ncbi:LamG-like jellyroll fold domain-containing protein [Salarchaeum sp. III]|uniref:LamG-like jellyroll fold domain-containing protein n=1 Tax=Salarchaeum sp. III TaxID=3107927 RepID=UPI002ED7BC29
MYSSGTHEYSLSESTQKTYNRLIATASLPDQGDTASIDINGEDTVSLPDGQITTGVSVSPATAFTFTSSLSNGDTETSSPSIARYEVVANAPPRDFTVSLNASEDVALSWALPPGVKATEVYRAEDSGSATGDYSRIASLSNGETTYTDSSLVDGESYYYRIRATYENTASNLTEEQVATTTLPAPTLDSLDAGTLREITVSYTLPDNSTDGDIVIERSTDGGATWTTVATITDLSKTSYTDTGLLDGVSYTYRLQRRTDHASAESGTLSATTILPAMTGLSVSGVDSTSAVVTARDNANNKAGYRAWVGPDGYLSFGGFGSGDYVEIPHDPAMEATDALTIAVELEPTALNVDSNNNYRQVCQQANGTRNNSLLIEQNGQFNGSVSIGGNRVAGRSDYNVSVGERVSVVYTYDASSGDWVYWINGSQDNTGVGPTGTLDTFTYPLRFSTSDSSQEYAGHIYRVCYDNRVWDSSQVSEWENGGVPSDPILYHELNQGSGSTAVDYGPNGLDGTVYGSPTWHGGGSMVQDNGDLPPQYSQRFTADGQYATGPSSLAIEGQATSMTVMFTFRGRQEDLNGWAGAIHSSGLFGGNAFGVIDDAGAFDPTIGDDAGNSYRAGNASYQYDEPSLFALTYDRPNGRMANWVNATEKTSNNSVGQITLASDSNEMALSSGGSAGWWKGDIGEIWIYSRALSQSEQQATMNGNPPTDGLEHHWVFTDNTLNSVPDTENSGKALDVSNGSQYAPKVLPVRHTLDGLKNGEQYVTRMSVYTDDTETYDQ